MLLLVIRHAIAAEPRLPDPEADAKRELTEEGRDKMRRAAKGLSREFDAPQVLASSPLVRAHQTAEIVAKAYGGLKIEIVDALSPDEPLAALGRWLAGQEKHERVAIVGHEPHLAQAVSWLLTGSDRIFVKLKKGAACLLDFPGKVAPGHATLRWSLLPSHLRGFAE